MQEKKTYEEIQDLLAKVKYKNWELRVIEKTEESILCQWIFHAKDNDHPETEQLERQACRKWYISRFSTESEIIRTAYKAVKEAEAHEVDENFTFAGIRLYDPHVDLLELAIYMKHDARQDVREPLKQ